MKKILFKGILYILTLLTIFQFGNILYAQPTPESNFEGNSPKVNVHVFYSNSCPHCSKEREFLSSLENKIEFRDSLKISYYEISKKDNLALFVYVSKYFKENQAGVPFLVIGDNHLVGYAETQGYKDLIENLIGEELNKDNGVDVVQNIINDKFGDNKANKNNEDKEALDNKDTENESENKYNNQNSNNPGTDIHLPIIGDVNSGSFSLPVLTFIIALLDGFNPCAMWVLLFLISMLLGMKDKKKMWILGSTFILTSGLVYFLFLAAWLNFFLLLGYVSIIRIIIGMCAIGIGIYYLSDYIKNKNGGCKVTNNQDRKKWFDKIKTIIEQKNLLISIIGIVILAFAVNIVELLCSAGLPAVYTKILSMSDLPKIGYHLYLLFYTIIFMFDDLLVFGVAMFSLKTIGIESKYSRFSHLVGGILVISIGLLLLFKPELLSFN